MKVSLFDFLGFQTLRTTLTMRKWRCALAQHRRTLFRPVACVRQDMENTFMQTLGNDVESEEGNLKDNVKVIRWRLPWQVGFVTTP